jgi:hypothetical protein
MYRKGKDKGQSAKLLFTLMQHVYHTLDQPENWQEAINRNIFEVYMYTNGTEVCEDFLNQRFELETLCIPFCTCYYCI